MEIAAAVIGFIFFVANALLSLLSLAIFVWVVLSWLFVLDIINRNNRFVGQIAYALERFTAPVLAPLRAVVPNLGGIDITPIIALILIQGVKAYLMPAAYGAALSLVGAG